MGNVESSPTFNFFLDSFAGKDKFMLDFQGNRLLFSYDREEISENKIKLVLELLDRPHERSSVTIRSLGNCECKSDAKKYEPSAEFYIYFNLDGFHHMKYINKTKEFKKLISSLEKSLSK